MNAPLHNDQPPSQFIAETHTVENVSRELADYNLFTEDCALREALQREGAGWAQQNLEAFGSRIGTADYLQLGFAANRYPPEFDTHDRFGNRVDLVNYHPAYHRLEEAEQRLQRLQRDRTARRHGLAAGRRGPRRAHHRRDGQPDPL